MIKTNHAAAALLALAAAACSPGDAAPRPSVAGSPTDPAVALFERRTAADPRDHLSATTLAELHLARADELESADDFPLAENAARTALERQPSHGPAAVALARALAGQGRGTESARMLEGLLDLQPRNARALEAAFDVEFAAGHDVRAAALADRLLAINEEPGTLSRLAQAAARRGATDEAIALFRGAAAAAGELGGLPSESARHHRLAGWTLLTAKRPAEAAGEFDLALAANPNDRGALRGRGACAVTTASTGGSR